MQKKYYPLTVLLTILFIAIGYLQVGAQNQNAKQVYWPNQFNSYPEVDLAKSYQTDNFIIVWGDLLGNDPINNGTTDIQFDPANIGAQLEFLYNKYVNEWNWLDGSVGNLSLYKMVIVMNDTWATGPWTGFAYGGGYDEVIGAMWIHPGAALPNSFTLAHEFTHSMQAQTLIEFPNGGFNDGPSGFFWEKHANYVASRAYPDDPGVSTGIRHINCAHYHFNSTRKRYESFALLQYFEDKFGIDINFRVWREALRNNKENPLMTYKRILGMTQSEFGDLMGDYAQKALFYDFLGADGDLIRNHAWNVVEKQFQPRKYTYLEPLPETGAYKVIDAMSPQDYGVNTVQLDVSDVASNNNSICLDFYGHQNLPADGVSYRFAFVATPDNGENLRYSDVFSAPAGQIESANFNVLPGEKVYLVVTPVPDVHHAYEWEVGYPKIYRYPWQIKIAGATPYINHHEGVAGSAHPNGGGFVANSANVAASVYVGPNAAVLGNSDLFDNVRVEDQAVVTNSVLSDNVIIRDAGVAIFSNGSGDIIVEETAALWWQTNSGNPHFGGDNEQYSGCSSGYYRQVGNPGVAANGRSNCDGLSAHPANDDVNPSFPIFVFGQALSCNNCADAGGDFDGDGICADVDCNDNDANISTVGSTCDDGDENTVNDIIGEDCICAGAIADLGLDLVYNVVMGPRTSYTPNTINIDGAAIADYFGLSTAQVAAELGNSITYYAVEPNGNLNPNSTANYPGHWFNNTGETISWADAQSFVYSELSISAMTINIGQYPNRAVGGEMLQIKQALIRVDNANNPNRINLIFNITIDACADAGGDFDGDGICADIDCNDNDASVPAAIGSTCDDENADTENDVYGEDACTCAGTLIDNDGDGVTASLDCNDNDASVPAIVGSTCDDENADTENDVYGEDACTCAGTLIDNDGDGVTASLDCNDNDASVPAAIGSTCDDENADTENDVYGEDGCTCAGTLIDNDGDGVTASLDCDDNDASVPAIVGSTCDDENADTENDVYGEDGCTCAGTPIETGCNPTYTISGNTVTLNGLNGAHNAINAYIQPSWADAYSCFDNCDSSFELPDGEYYLHIKIFDASYQVECALQEYITIDGSSACTTGAACNDGDLCTENDVWDADCNCVGTAVVDADNDGLCANEDCDDSDPNIPSTPGTTCDDGDPNTENDVYGSDGCTCAGTPIGACNPTYTISGNTLTVNGLTGAHNAINTYNQPSWADAYSCFDNCDSSFELPDGEYYLHIKIMDEGYQVECALQEYITIDGSAACNTGSACNDGDLCTENDVWDADCNCIGTPVIDADDDGLCANEDCDDNDPNLPATPGNLCNDGNPSTINDAIQADGCTCAGLDPSGCNITITPGLNEITIDGVNGDHVIIHVFDATWATVFNCLDNCDNPQIVSGLPSGTYYVKATNYDASWSPTCENIDYYTVSGSSNLESSNQEYLFFEADKSGAKVQLNWVTNVDDKTSYYEIERSIDGLSFETIGQITSRSEMNTATSYDDWDVSPKDGVNFYRINQILEDGTVRNSTVEVVTLDKQFNHFLVYPNPAVDQLNIELNDFIGEAATIQIYNQLGHLMTSRSIESLTADAEVFDLNGYSSGVYAITIRTGNGKRLTKLFVVNK